MSLRPIHNSFLFTFLNDTLNGTFINRNKGNIIIATPELDKQGILARWVKVLAVGNEVENFGVGDIVLVSPGKWTSGIRYEEKIIWKSDEDQVLGIGDESMAYDYAVTSSF